MADQTQNPTVPEQPSQAPAINWNKVLGWIGGLILLFITIWVISRAWRKGQQ